MGSTPPIEAPMCRNFFTDSTAGFGQGRPLSDCFLPIFPWGQVPCGANVRNQMLLLSGAKEGRSDLSDSGPKAIALAFGVLLTLSLALSSCGGGKEGDTSETVCGLDEAEYPAYLAGRWEVTPVPVALAETSQFNSSEVQAFENGVGT